ncbi:hypothetical protein L9F63_017184, partial [Diploptera punctata]
RNMLYILNRLATYDNTMKYRYLLNFLYTIHSLFPIDQTMCVQLLVYTNQLCYSNKAEGKRLTLLSLLKNRCNLNKSMYCMNCMVNVNPLEIEGNEVTYLFILSYFSMRFRYFSYQSGTRNRTKRYTTNTDPLENKYYFSVLRKTYAVVENTALIDKM